MSSEKTIPINSRYELRSPDGNTIHLLGEGAFARVYLGRDRNTNAEVAFKVPTIMLSDRSSEEEMGVDTESLFDYEIEKLKQLDHLRNVIHYCSDAYFDFEQLVFVLLSKDKEKNQKSHYLRFVDPPPSIQDCLQKLNDAIRNPTVPHVNLQTARSNLRAAVRSESAFFSTCNIPLRCVLLNGIRYVVTDKYQATFQELASDWTRLDPEAVLLLIESSLSALVTLHMRGIRHGDIAPDNIMFDSSDRIVSEKLREQINQQPSLSKEGHRLVDWRAILIDVGMVLHNQTHHERTINVPTMLQLRREKTRFAAHETQSVSNDLSTIIESYQLELPEDDNGHIRLTRIVNRTAGNIINIFGNPQGPPDSADSDKDLVMALKDILQPGDIIYNSTYGFTVKDIGSSNIELDKSRVYRVDGSYALRPMYFADFRDEIEPTIHNIFHDPLKARRGYGIPADLFSFAMCIVFIITTRQKMRSGDVARFVDRIRSEGVQKKRAIDGWFTIGEEVLSDVKKCFEADDFTELFRIVLRCTLRGPKDKGYYCSSHSDDDVLCTINAFCDLITFRKQWLARQILKPELSRLNELQFKLELAESAVKNADHDKQDLQQQLEIVNNEVLSERGRGIDLEHKLQDLELKLAECHQARAAAQKSYSESQHVVHELNANANQLAIEHQKAIDELKRSMNKLEQEKHSVAAQLKQYSDKVEEQDRRIKKISDDKSTAEANLLKVAEELKSHKDHANTASGEKTKLATEFGQRESKLILESKADKQKISQLDDQLKEANSRLEQESKAKEEAERKLQQQLTAAKTAQVQLGELQKKYERAERERDTLASSLHRAQVDLETERSALAAREQEWRTYYQQREIVIEGIARDIINKLGSKGGMFSRADVEGAIASAQQLLLPNQRQEQLSVTTSQFSRNMLK